MNAKDLLNTPISKLKFAVVDVETTGMHYEHSKVMDIGVVLIENGQISQRWESLIDPKQRIPYWITKYTRLKDSDVAGEPQFSDIALELNDMLEKSVFVAHNVSFDYSFLKAEMRRVNMEFFYPRLCTVLLARKLLPQLSGANLDVLSDYYEISISARHRALPDAEATALIFLEFIKIAQEKYSAKSFFDLDRLQRIRINRQYLENDKNLTLL